MDYTTDGTDDFFNRLPEEVQAEVLENIARREAAAREYRLKLNRRRVSAFLFGTIGTFIFSLPLMGTSWFGALAMSVSAGILGVGISHWKLCHLTGIILFGINAMFWSLGGPMSVSGIGAAGAGAMTISSWILHCFLGLIVAKRAELQRMREDTY